MFYCNPCGAERGWPLDEGISLLMVSYGPCELCHVVSLCNDIPSRHLPPPPSTNPHVNAAADQIRANRPEE